MRVFYEEWEPVLNRQPLAGDLVLDEKLLLSVIRQPLADEFNWSDFFSIGFSHHIEIISKAKTLEARLFYIHECAIRYWSKYTLRDYLKADLYSHRGTLPNNFAQTLPDTKQALKAVCSFKDEYLLDFINVEELNEQEEVYHGMTGRFALSHAHRLHENLVETGSLAQDDRLTRLAGHAA